MNSCINCNESNPNDWFYCKSCGERASKPKFTTNMYMISETAKRTDIEFSSTTMDKTIERAKKERSKQGQKFWDGKLKEFKKRRGYASS